MYQLIITVHAGCQCYCHTMILLGGTGLLWTGLLWTGLHFFIMHYALCNYVDVYSFLTSIIINNRSEITHACYMN